MALVSGGGGGSTLNPNAPLYIPACLRQVEDFSPEWWDLVTTSTWFRDYWLSQNQVEDFSSNDEDDDIIDLLPVSIDVDQDLLDEDLMRLESQLEEFFQSSEAEKENIAYFSAAKNLPKNDDVDALVKSLMFSRGRGPRFVVEPIKHLEKPGKRVSPKCSPCCIQQPR